MKKLNIAQLSLPFINLPPRTSGGTEWVTCYLTEGLIKKGHRVTLFSTKNSKTSAMLRYMFKDGIGSGRLKKLFSPLAWRLPWAHGLPFLMHALMPFKMADKFDVIHNHFHYYGLFFSSLVRTPVLTTFHGDPVTAEKCKIEKQILEKYKQNSWVAISRSQKRQTKTKLNFQAVIHHGIPIEKFSWNKKPQDYLIWLGRITQRKGLEEAIKITKRSGNKLIIAGTLDTPGQKEFFKKKIKPEVDSRLIFYVGPANHRKKVRLLSNAKALLYPISWEEPFGLVMIEAQACGCPVIALKKGSVPELVKDKKTGFVVRNIKEMIKALNNIDQINREDCRRHIERNFTVEKMVEEYEKVYYRILSEK